MAPILWTSQTDRIPEDVTVRDYDELTGDAKHALPAAAATGTAPITLAAAEQFVDLDIVRYTDYYRVAVLATRTDATGSADDVVGVLDAVPEPR